MVAKPGRYTDRETVFVRREVMATQSTDWRCEAIYTDSTTTIGGAPPYTVWESSSPSSPSRQRGVVPPDDPRTMPFSAPHPPPDISKEREISKEKAHTMKEELNLEEASHSARKEDK